MIATVFIVAERVFGLSMASNYESIDEKTFQGMCQYYDHIPLGVCVLQYVEKENTDFDFQTVYVNEYFEDIVNCPKTMMYKMTIRSIVKNLKEDLYVFLKYAAVANMGFEDERYIPKLNKYIKLKCAQYKPGYVIVFIWDSTTVNEESNQLKEANEKIIERMDIIHSLSNVYYACYSIELDKNIGIEIKSVDKIRKFIPKKCAAQEGLVTMCDNLIKSDYNNEMRHFVDLSTLRQRMKDKNIISHEFIGIESGWSRASFISTKRDENGDVTQVIYVTQHIDEEKQKELDYQKNLEEAVETAKKAEETRTRFLASMSHDIRTPINGIIGLIDMESLETQDPDVHKKHMQKIRTSAQQLLSIMNDVLEVSKLENGIVGLAEVEFDVVDLLNTANQYEGGMPPMKIVLDTEAVKNRRVIGSPAHIRQIMYHIIGNAVKFNTKNGSIHVKVSQGEYVDGKMQYIFEVADSGIGMSDSFIKHIFEPFTQEHGGARTCYTGTGLGMAIVKRLVDEMKGSIDISSKVNVGTIVTVVIPLLPAEEKEANTSQNDAAQEVDVAGMKALLVEDNEINAEIAQFILESADIKVTTAENGKIAVDTFGQSGIGEFDMILMDIMMPVMDGLEATREIRAMERIDAKKVPIIAVTANTFPEDIKKSYEAGMDGHVGKPINSETLIGAIKKHKKEKANTF